MIGHQAVGPDGGTGAPRCRGDETAIKAIIVGRENHRLAPIAALGNMGNSGTTTRAIRAMPALPAADLPDVDSGVAQSCKLSP